MILITLALIIVTVPVALAALAVWTFVYLMALMFNLIMPDWDAQGNDVPVRVSARNAFRLVTFRQPVVM